MAARLAALSERLAALDRMRQTLGYTETLRRGFAVVRGDGGVVTTRAAAEAAGTLEIEFQDGRLAALAGPQRARRGKSGTEQEPGGEQGSLF